jgi:hypothetical protein
MSEQPDRPKTPPEMYEHFYVPAIFRPLSRHGPGLTQAQQLHDATRRRDMQAPEVLSASERDQSRVLDVITLAFSDDPMVRWALPNPATPRNIPLYQRHGFEITGNIQAGASPAIVPMLRRPR